MLREYDGAPTTTIRMSGPMPTAIIFLDADTKLNDEIDSAYHGKYRRHGADYLNMMVSPRATGNYQAGTSPNLMSRRRERWRSANSGKL